MCVCVCACCAASSTTTLSTCRASRRTVSSLTSRRQRTPVSHAAHTTPAAHHIRAALLCSALALLCCSVEKGQVSADKKVARQRSVMHMTTAAANLCNCCVLHVPYWFQRSSSSATRTTRPAPAQRASSSRRATSPFPSPCSRPWSCCCWSTAVPGLRCSAALILHPSRLFSSCLVRLPCSPALLLTSFSAPIFSC